MKIYFVQTKTAEEFKQVPKWYKGTEIIYYPHHVEIMIYYTNIYFSKEEMDIFGKGSSVIRKGLYDLDDNFIEQAEIFAQRIEETNPFSFNYRKKLIKETKDILTRGCNKLEKAIRLAYLRDYANSMN